LQSVDELLEFMETWDIAITFATCHPVNDVYFCRFKNNENAQINLLFSKLVCG